VALGSRHPTTIQFLYVPSTIEDKRECTVLGTKGFAKHYGFDESDLLETTKILLDKLKKNIVG
jgi:hypothetical protein